MSTINKHSNQAFLEAMEQRILIVEDDPDITELLSYNLEKEGYEVYTVDNGADAIRAAKKHLPSLVLLDIMLPAMDGMEVCRQLREMPQLDSSYIVFLTARGEEYSEVAAFQMGADDYIIKPIKPRALIKRLDAIFKRSRFQGQNPSKSSEIEAGNIKLDRNSYTLAIRDEESTLPKKEFELLWLLMSNPNIVFNRQQILDKVWEPDVEVLERTVDVHVRRVREKIGEGYIQTVKGVGYKFDYRPKE
ncbi:MAG: response regulator transcription factor [Flammeovirgaceae bacterium]